MKKECKTLSHKQKQYVKLLNSLSPEDRKLQDRINKLKLNTK